MRNDEPENSLRSTDGNAVRLVLREAKRLHRAAVSDSLAASLPVLRRLIASGILHGLSLPELSRRREIVRRKHVLQMLAIEASRPDWAEYRKDLASMDPGALPHFDILQRAAGYPNLWFSSPSEAEAHVAEHGGRSIRVGRQAVVIASPGPD